MLRATKGVVGVVGRIMLCAVFVAAAVGYTAPNASNVAQSIAASGTLAPKWILVGGIVLLVIGSLSVVMGYRARLGASLLLTLLVLATYHFHGFTFWTLVNAARPAGADLPLRDEPVDDGGHALHHRQWAGTNEPRRQTTVSRCRPVSFGEALGGEQ